MGLARTRPEATPPGAPERLPGERGRGEAGEREGEREGEAGERVRSGGFSST